VSMSSNWIAGLLWRLSAVGSLTMLGSSCQSTTSKEAPNATAASAQVVEPRTGEVAPLDRIDETNFQLTWTLLRGDGKSGEGELVLVAKSPFKPNQEYPHKLKLKGKDITPTKSELTKEDMQVSLERVVVPVRFEISGADPSLEGTLAFSVCTAEACLIERKDIRLNVTGPSGKSNAAPPAVGVAPTATAAASK
jgi:hypothetical protein